LTLVSSLLGSSIVHAQFTGPGGRETQTVPPGPVVDLRFEGNSAISDAELATVTATKVTGFFSRLLYSSYLFRSFGAPYQTLDYATLARDTAALNLYYKDHGYLL